jgi:hypothetical protein
MFPPVILAPLYAKGYRYVLLSLMGSTYVQYHVTSDERQVSPATYTFVQFTTNRK